MKKEKQKLGKKCAWVKKKGGVGPFLLDFGQFEELKIPIFLAAPAAGF